MSRLLTEFKKFSQDKVQISFSHKPLAVRYNLVSIRNLIPLENSLIDQLRYEFHRSSNQYDYFSAFKTELQFNDGLNFHSRMYLGEKEFQAIKYYAAVNYGLDLQKLEVECHYDYFCFAPKSLQVSNSRIKNLPFLPNKIYTHYSCGLIDWMGKDEEDSCLVEFLSLLSFMICNPIQIESDKIFSSHGRFAAFYTLFESFTEQDFSVFDYCQCENLLQDFLTYQTVFVDLVKELNWLGTTKDYTIDYQTWIKHLQRIVESKTKSFLIGFWES